MPCSKTKRNWIKCVEEVEAGALSKVKLDIFIMIVLKLVAKYAVFSLEFSVVTSQKLLKTLNTL